MPELPESGEPYIGVVGNLVSGVMQTAGFYFQNAVIDDLGALLNSIAVFVFVIALIGCLTMYVLTGKLRSPLFFLITPSLFYLVLTVRTPAMPTLIAVGNRAPEKTLQDTQLDMLKKFGNIDPTKTPRVSWLFAKIDRVVSHSTQALVSFLVDTENKKDLINAAREKLYQTLFTNQAVDPDMLSLLSTSFSGTCGTQAQLWKEIYDEAAQVGALVTDLKKDGKVIRPRRSDNDPEVVRLKDSVVAKSAELNKRQANPIQFTLSQTRYIENKAPKEGIVNNTPLTHATCGKLTRIIKEIMLNDAAYLFDRETNRGAKGNDGTDWLKVRDNFVRSLICRPDQRCPCSEGASCPPAAREKANEILAAYMLRNTLKSNATTTMLAKVDAKNPRDIVLSNGLYKITSRFDQREGLFNLQYYAGIVPYVQGFLLFLLAASFPFFALFLLIPGKTSSFMTWVALWAWVKSWDVGFASIHVIREILWEYFTGKELLKDTSTVWAGADLGKILTEVIRNDPVSNLGLYFSIIAIVTMAVPFVTANLFLNAPAMYGSVRGLMETSVRKLGSAYRREERRKFATLVQNTQYADLGSHALNAQAKFYETMFEGMSVEDKKIYAQSPSGYEYRNSADGAAARAASAVFGTERMDQYFSPRQMLQKKMLAQVAGRGWAEGSNSRQAQTGQDAIIEMFVQNYTGGNLSEIGTVAVSPSAGKPTDDNVSTSGVGLNQNTNISVDKQPTK
jgi:hypothetical protein